MRRALELARQAWGRTHPNPLVGAVITEGGVIVAEGFHAAAGQPHAEVMALRALGRPPKPDAVLHVTLEPCCTHGRTPPCVDAILRAGVRTVVVGATDPNPAHAGKGIQLLRAAGVAVVEGVLGEECAELNFLFNHWITVGRPLLALKVAATLDGKLVPAPGEPRDITGPAARADVHRWRRLFPAIAVTADTLLADNPRLTARDAEGEHAPVRFVLDRRFRSAGRAGLNLFTDAFRGRTIVVGLAAGARAADLAWYEAEGVKVWALPGEEADFLDAWAERCATEGLTGVLIEAGPRFASALLRAGAADYLFAYVAPRLGGDPESPTWFEGVDFPLMAGKTSLFGQDALFRGYLG
ncbi:MAG: Riboflavin biosynthesis protein RibD [Verrucomicrobiota bacterium]|jgi:diaminohydroxyphosphoribosylaminopyrimidine deaminase/5-amino-6-(5-phosphoribosylamino)uracil reductase